MSNASKRRDRTARLLKLQMLLYQYPHGLKIEEIAHKISKSKKTVYRDLRVLENELDVPLWEEGSRRGIVEGYFLPPIHFTLAEATNIFFAARLMQNLSRQCNPGITSTFMKLGAIVPVPLREHIQNTIEYLEKQPKDERRINNFNKLTDAWISQHQVKIRYQELSGGEPVQHTIGPYFIEPTALGHSGYVIAYCHLKKLIRGFSIDQIVGEVVIGSETYEIPPDFNAIDYLDSAWGWGVYTNEEPETVKLHFKQKIGKAIKGMNWHPSQKMEVLSDGSIMMMLRVRNTADFRGWILGWGDNVEVLKPKKLRNQIIETNKSVTDMYSRKDS